MLTQRWQAIMCIAVSCAGVLAMTASSAAAQPEFAVMNTSESPPDGVWFRFGPDPNQTNRTTGLGVYMGEHVRAKCYWHGTPFGPYQNDVWYYAYDIERPTAAGVSNEGWINTHYVDDAMTANNPNPSVPPCTVGSGDGGAAVGGSSGGGSTGGGQASIPEGASAFFQPQGHDTGTTASTNVGYDAWAGENCKLRANAVANPFNGAWLSTLAGWSNGRLGPIFYLAAANAEQLSHVHYVLLIDPGDGSAFTRRFWFKSCEEKSPPSKVLATWLATSGANRLMVISAQATARDDHRGLQKFYLQQIKAQKLNKQVRVCNDDKLTHGQAFKKYAQNPTTSYISSRKFTCPAGVHGWQP